MAAVDENQAARLRQEAAADRERSLEDRRAGARERSQAEIDREIALADRKEGAGERARAELDRNTALADRQAGAGERWHAFADRDSALADRQAGADERSQARADRQTASADRGASATARESSSFDDLTGVYRRGAGFVELGRDVARARRLAQPLVLAFVDVDHLKAVNDVHGHAAGDRLLVAVTVALRSELRSHDLLVRHGGDEFICAMLGMTWPRRRCGSRR